MMSEVSDAGGRHAIGFPRYESPRALSSRSARPPVGIDPIVSHEVPQQTGAACSLSRIHSSPSDPGCRAGSLGGGGYALDHPPVGSQGRSLTRLDPSGQVEFDGSVFQAETSMFGAAPRRAPVPPDRVIVVSGWRMDNEHGVVLLIADPTAPVPEPGAAVAGAVPDAGPSPPPPTPEERIEALERQLQGVLRTVGRSRSSEHSVPVQRVEEEGGVGRLLLTFGQVMSAVGCIATPVYALVALSRAADVRERVRDAPNPTMWIVVGAALVFLYSAAMFVVFGRCKRVPPE